MTEKFAIGDLVLVKRRDVNWTNDQTPYLYGIVIEIPKGPQRGIIMRTEQGSRLEYRRDKIILVAKA